jgi:hypothetical protein
VNRVLLTFKPLRALKNEVLVKEGDMVEEMIFVKNGLLSIEVSVNISKFITENELNDYKEIGDTLNAIIVHDYQPDDIRIIKIVNIRKNDHFGDVLMFLNRPSILRVRVKSKLADLFLMKKIEMANIARHFPDIFKKIYSKSVSNMDKIETLVENAKSIYINEKSKKTNNITTNQSKSIYENKSKESLKPYISYPNLQSMISLYDAKNNTKLNDESSNPFNENSVTFDEIVEEEFIGNINIPFSNVNFNVDKLLNDEVNRDSFHHCDRENILKPSNENFNIYEPPQDIIRNESKQRTSNLINNGYINIYNNMTLSNNQARIIVLHLWKNEFVRTSDSFSLYSADSEREEINLKRFYTSPVKKFLLNEGSLPNFDLVNNNNLKETLLVNLYKKLPKKTVIKSSKLPKRISKNDSIITHSNPVLREKKTRQSKMLEEVKKNIVSSNWLLDIHKKQKEEVEKTNNLHELHHFSKRLDTIRSMFKYKK